MDTQHIHRLTPARETVTSFSTASRARLRRARRPAWQGSEQGRGHQRGWVSERRAHCRGGGGRGHSPLVGGRLAPRLQRAGAPARAAAATRSAPHPSPVVPAVTTPSCACKSCQVVLPRRAILPPCKDHSQGRTSSLRCGRSTLTLIFHGKDRRLSGRTAQCRDVLNVVPTGQIVTQRVYVSRVDYELDAVYRRFGLARLCEVRSMLRRPVLFVLAPLSAVAVLLLTLSPAGATPDHSQAVRDTKSACHVRTHVRQLGTHRTKNSVVRTQRVTVTLRGAACRRGRAGLEQLGTHRTKNSVARFQRASASASGIRTSASCSLNEEVAWRADVDQLHGEVWTDSCTGQISCYQTAELQEESPPDPGTWFTIKEGDQTEGCTRAHDSDTNKDCHATLTTYTYRTLGIFVIFWDDGTNNTYDGHTDGLTIPDSC
jgi:hypothetical protein